MTALHDHYCNHCKKVYKCEHRLCKHIFIRICLFCRITEDELDQTIDDHKKD